MEIRRLGPGDEDLLQSALLAFATTPSAAPDLFLGDPRSHAFVATEGEQVVGWCYGYELLRPEGRWMMLLKQIEVVEERRRERVGRRLLETFVELARSKGHSKMWLYTDAGTRAARALYEDVGADPRETLGIWWVFG